MYKEDLPLNNLQWLMCHKTKPNSPRSLLDGENLLDGKFSLFFLFFFLNRIGSIQLAVIRWSVCVPENFMHFIHWNGFLFVHIPFGSMLRIISPVQFLVDHLPQLLSLVLYSFFHSLLLSLITWVIVISPFNLYRQFCFILQIFA